MDNDVLTLEQQEDACYLYRDLSEMLQIEDEEDQCWKQHEGAA